MQKRKEIYLLDSDLQEILDNIKKECLSMATIPYNGIVDRIDTTESTTIIHSLIPGLEPYHLIRIIKDKVESFLVKGNIAIPLLEESILILIKNIYIKSKDKFQKEKNILIDLDIPKEIIESMAYLEESSNNELNNLYEMFAQNVAGLREVKKEYVLYEINTSDITLQKSK